MSCQLKLMMGSTNRLTVRNVRDLDGAPIESATGTVTLYDKRSGTPLAGQSWPASLVWSPTAKEYRVTLASTLVVAKRQFLIAIIMLDSGGGFVFYDDPEIQVGTPSSP